MNYEKLFTPGNFYTAGNLNDFKHKAEPTIDEPVSKVVGKKIYQRDPRLIKLIMKWKANKPADDLTPDNFLKDPNKVKELKKVMNGDL